MDRADTRPLSKLCDQSRSICYGIVQPGKATPGGVPIVRVNNFKDNSLDLSDVLSVSHNVEAKYGRSRPKPNDVLVSLVGSIGQVSIAPEGIRGWNIARAVGLVPTTDRHHACWIYYALQAPAAQDFIQQRANTTVQATFNLKDLSQLPVPYPDPKTRQQTIDILGSLDDKIELNRRMNATLEGMAQAIFRDWFVDFGPTRRKQAGVNDPVQIMGNLLPDPTRAQPLADLFPASFGDNGLPEGWEENDLSSYVTLNSQGWTAKHHPEFVEYIDLSNTKWGSIEKSTEYSWDDAPSRARRITQPGDTIVGTVRPANGSYANIDREGLTASTGFAVLRPMREAARELVYCAATAPENIERLGGLADGGAYPAVRPDLIVETPIPLVSDSLVDALSSLLAPVFTKIAASKQQNQTLAATRDLLLPKLMSGEIRVSEAKAAVGKAA